jgi:hypothetical protein
MTNAHQFAQASASFATALRWVSPIVLVAGFIPFFTAKCPKCRGRFNGLGNIARNFDGPLPCATCGFDPQAHIPRYGKYGA